MALANAAMTPYRYEKWARNRKLIRKIQDALRAGYRVTLGTYLRATTYDYRHLDQFEATRLGAYVKVGRKARREDISGCAVVISR